jgi:hypothetical protein
MILSRIFKAQRVGPLYMREPNRSEPAPISVLSSGFFKKKVIEREWIHVDPWHKELSQLSLNSILCEY